MTNTIIEIMKSGSKLFKDVMEEWRTVQEVIVTIIEFRTILSNFVLQKNLAIIKVHLGIYPKSNGKLIAQNIMRKAMDDEAFLM